MNIRALIFDFDGLIVDTESTEFQGWQELYTAHGCDLSPDVYVDCIGRPNGHFDFYSHLEKVSGTRIDRDAVRARRRARLAELNLLLPVLPGVLSYLEDAQRLGLKIGLASSSSRAWVHGHLERLGLFEFFGVTKCVEDTGTHKPDPGPYVAVLDALNISAPEAIAFEDAPHGIVSAKAAGITCVAVPNPMTRNLPLDRADYQLSSLAAMSLEELMVELFNDRSSRPVTKVR
jgi:HAD superfamily hydrolase (TIGR01509 family)